MCRRRQVLGAIAAAMLLSVIADTRVFMMLFGVGVGLAVLLSAFNHSLAKSSGSLATMGGVSGLMGTITGVGAPPLALVYQGSYAGDARATLAAIFGYDFSPIIINFKLAGAITGLVLSGSG